MGLFVQAVREIRGYRLQQFSPQSTAYWVAKLFGGGFQTASGVNVTPELAMAIGTVYASCRNVAEDLAGLPLPVYRDNVTTAGASMGASMGAPKVIDRSIKHRIHQQRRPPSQCLWRLSTVQHTRLLGESTAIGIGDTRRRVAQQPSPLCRRGPSRVRVVRD